MLKYRKKPKQIMGLFLAGLVFCLAGEAYAAPRAAKGKESALLEAAKRGEVAEVNRLLEQGVRVNAKDKDGNTALIFAAQFRRRSVVQALLEKGAEVNAKNRNGWTALMWAAKGDENIILKTGYTFSGIPQAEIKGVNLIYDPNILDTLLAHGADVNVKDKNGFTPLMMSAARGHLHAVKALLDKGAEVNIKNKYGQTPLMAVAVKGVEDEVLAPGGRIVSILTYYEKPEVTEIVKTLLDKGAKIDDTDNEGKTALHFAVEWKNWDMFNVLLDHGAEINAKDKDGRTVLMKISEEGNQNMVEKLLAKGAEVNAKDKNGRTALMEAASWGNKEVVKALLEKGAEINSRDNDDSTCLMLACGKELKKRYKDIEKKIKPKETEEKDIQSLFLEVVQHLLDKNAEVNVKDKTKATALMYAAGAKFPKIVEALLAKGADVNVKDNMGKTAWDYAEDNETKNLLQKVMAQ